MPTGPLDAGLPRSLDERPGLEKSKLNTFDVNCLFGLMESEYAGVCNCADVRIDSADNEIIDLLCDKLFPRGGSWRNTVFPEECQDVLEAFMLLSPCASSYYYAAYMKGAVDNPYYRMTALYAVEDILSDGDNFARRLWQHSSVGQREAMQRFCLLLSQQVVGSWIEVATRLEVSLAKRLIGRMRELSSG